MRPNLSFETLATTLTALGAGALIAACGGSNVKANEVPASGNPQGHGQHGCSAANGCGAKAEEKKPTGQHGCSANGCGAKGTPTTAPTTAASTDTPPAAPTAAPTTPPATPAPATTTAAAQPPKPVATAAPPKPVNAPKPPPPKAQSKCGPGTCDADPKKKLW
jgi:hypothetical protein